jgi:hypothetical protein
MTTRVNAVELHVGVVEKLVLNFAAHLSDDVEENVV